MSGRRAGSGSARAVITGEVPLKAGRGARVRRRRRPGAIRDGRGERRSAALGDLLRAAGAHREAGRLPQAASLYRTVIARAPDSGEALHWLGVIEQRRGRHEAAFTLLERAAALRPEDAQCAFHLAELLRALGRHAEAVHHYRRALTHRSDIADVHFGFGTSLLELGEAQAAEGFLRRALGLSPLDPEIHNNLGNALSGLERHGEAIEHYRRALDLRPGFLEALMNLGAALAASGDKAAAEATLRAAVAAGGARSDTRLALARLLEREGRLDEAIEMLEEAVQIAPEEAAAHTLLGRCLLKDGRMEAARLCHERALELAPELAEGHFNLGVCLQAEGRFEEAARAHRRALALRPGFAEAHFNLGLMAKESLDEGALAALEALVDDGGVAEETRIHAGFALAVALEKRGETDAAFAHYRRANALEARSLAFDPQAHVAYIDRLTETFDEAFFAARSGWGLVSERPVLIVGMPRSGTSLVEQILASHPAVHGAGELDDLRRMVRGLPARLGTDERFPACARAIDREMAATLAQEYLDGLNARSTAALRVADKMPGNYLRLGLVALILPGTRVIHCLRSPLDTCVSCYCNHFAHGLSFTYDLGHLGLVYREYRRLMAHWSRVLRLPMMEVCYEDLVRDQETVSKRLVEFCGLRWDERCLSFHATSRAVRTASFWQVRQPLYTSSVGRWRAFARHLEPLIEALGPAADTNPR